MEIKINSEAAASIASAAIFDSLSQEARESVIQQAIQYLLTPEKDRNRYSHGKTPLQTAFEQALTVAAHKAVAERVESDPEIKAEIDKLLGPLTVQAIKASSENYRDELAEHVGVAVGRWLADKARER